LFNSYGEGNCLIFALAGTMQAIVLSQLLISAVLGAAVGRPTAQADLWQPAVADKIQMVLSGTVRASEGSVIPQNVNIFDIDLFDTPASTISTLRDQGIKVICYFSAGTSEDWRPDYSDFKDSDKGAGLSDWNGEKYLDLRSANVFNVMANRIRKASSAGCDAIDPDNMGRSTIKQSLCRLHLTNLYRRLFKWRRRLFDSTDTARFG
jgi:hypothetical protein